MDKPFLKTGCYIYAYKTFTLMTKICELKKGNWLLRRKVNSHDDSNNTYEAGRIEDIHENLIIFSQHGVDIKMEADDVLPIPLSEEILSQCGFEPFLVKEGIIVYSTDSERGKIFVSNLHGKGWRLSADLDAQTYLDVPFVHVMQNKYKRLAQKDWEVNLSDIREYTYNR